MPIQGNSTGFVISSEVSTGNIDIELIKLANGNATIHELIDVTGDTNIVKTIEKVMLIIFHMAYKIIHPEIQLL